MPVVHLSGEPPHDANQSSTSLVIDYKRLTPGKAKEMHTKSHSLKLASSLPC